MLEVRELQTGESHRAAVALLELRPHIGSADAVVARLDAQRASGYRLAASFEAGDADAAAVAGFRVGESLAWGRFLYVDDLVTRAELRGRGHAHAVMAGIEEEARRQGCGQLHLDSGVGPDRGMRTGSTSATDSGLRPTTSPGSSAEPSPTASGPCRSKPGSGGLALYAVLYMAATRTQIYLTKQQRARLDEIRRREGRPLAELVREAIDRYLERSAPSVKDALRDTAGALPELEVPARSEWDREIG